MALEKCDTCGGIHFRNAPCPPALLAKKSASAEKPAPVPRMTERSGESRKAKSEQAKKFPAPETRHPEGETRTEPKPVGHAVSSANPEAKATKGKAAPRQTPKPDRVASRSSAPDGEAVVGSRAETTGTQGPTLVSPAPAAKSKVKDTRKGDRHKAGYWSTYQRKDRMK